MSRDILEQVVARAVGDAAYRQLLRTNPTAALRGLRLTAQERAALTGGDPAKLVALGIDQRMSRAAIVGDDYMRAAHRDAGDTDVSAAERQLDPNRTDFAAVNRTAGETGPGATEARIGEPPGGEFDASLIVTPGESLSQTHLRLVEGMIDTQGGPEIHAGDSLPADYGSVAAEGGRSGLARIEGELDTTAAPSAVEGDLGEHTIEAGFVTAPDTVGGLYRLREGTEPAAGDATPAGATPFRTDILPDHEAAPSAVERDQWPGDSLPAGAMDTESAGIEGTFRLREGATTESAGIEGLHRLREGPEAGVEGVGGTWRLREGVEPAAGDSTLADAMGPVDTDAQQESMTNVEWSKPEAVEEPPSDADLTEY